MKRFLSRLRLQRTFRDEARKAAWRDLGEFKYEYHYQIMIDAYVRAYCRKKADEVLSSK
jgi:hypothetical protein